MNTFSKRFESVLHTSIRNKHNLLRFYITNIEKNLTLLSDRKDYLGDNECNRLDSCLQKIHFLLRYNELQHDMPVGTKYRGFQHE